MDNTREKRTDLNTKPIYSEKLMMWCLDRDDTRNPLVKGEGIVRLSVTLPSKGPTGLHQVIDRILG